MVNALICYSHAIKYGKRWMHWSAKTRQCNEKNPCRDKIIQCNRLVESLHTQSMRLHTRNLTRIFALIMQSRRLFQWRIKQPRCLCYWRLFIAWQNSHACATSLGACDFACEYCKHALKVMARPTSMRIRLWHLLYYVMHASNHMLRSYSTY